MITPWPRGAAEWIQLLEATEAGCEVDHTLAAGLRVMAATKPHAVGLCCGPAALPYIPWLRDGMSMDARLIIQLAPPWRCLDTLVQSQLDCDIRVASQYQALSAFCDDISAHQLDLIVLDVTDVDELENGPLKVLNDNALLVVLAGSQKLTELVDNYAAAYFISPMSSAVLLAKKGMQHGRQRAARRKRRR